MDEREIEKELMDSLKESIGVGVIREMNNILAEEEKRTRTLSYEAPEGAEWNVRISYVSKEEIDRVYKTNNIKR